MDRQERFGPFVLERLLGRGGMGAVYRAKHRETGQTVAVKTLLTPLESERERFEAEISTLKLLRHENIVKLHGFGQENGVLYYAMEYVDAPSLATLLKRGHTNACSGFVFQNKFEKKLFCTDKGKASFIALAKTYFAGGGQQYTVTVVSPEDLIDAKNNPDNHRNLIVRVGGYSDYFVNLDEALQDNVIERTVIEA